MEEAERLITEKNAVLAEIDKNKAEVAKKVAMLKKKYEEELNIGMNNQMDIVPIITNLLDVQEDQSKIIQNQYERLEHYTKRIVESYGGQYEDSPGIGEQETEEPEEETPFLRPPEKSDAKMSSELKAQYIEYIKSEVEKFKPTIAADPPKRKHIRTIMLLKDIPQKPYKDEQREILKAYLRSEGLLSIPKEEREQ